MCDKFVCFSERGPPVPFTVGMFCTSRCLRTALRAAASTHRYVTGGVHLYPSVCGFKGREPATAAA